MVWVLISLFASFQFYSVVSQNGKVHYSAGSLFLFFFFSDYHQVFLSLRFFGVLSSSLLLFPQRFSRYVLRPSSGVCQTLEPPQNFELRPLLNPRGVTYSDSVSHNRVQVLSMLVLLLACRTHGVTV